MKTIEILDAKMWLTPSSVAEMSFKFSKNKRFLRKKAFLARNRARDKNDS